MTNFDELPEFTLPPDVLESYKNHSDLQLLLLLREDSHEAFNEIYHRYAEPVLRFCYNKTGKHEIAEEIVQDLFVWVWTNRGDISTSLSLKPYLFKAAKNRILNYYRSSAVRQAYAADFKVFAEQYETPATANLEVSELLESIDSYMSDLPDRCRMAFHLSRVEHVSIPDIAEKMSISRRTVENYITIAARHLKKKMGLLPR